MPRVAKAAARSLALSLLLYRARLLQAGRIEGRVGEQAQVGDFISTVGPPIRVSVAAFS